MPHENYISKMTPIALGLTEIFYISHVLFIYFRFGNVAVNEDFCLFDVLFWLSLNRCIYFICDVLCQGETLYF
jgi:hypothetical protein